MFEILMTGTEQYKIELSDLHTDITTEDNLLYFSSTLTFSLSKVELQDNIEIKCTCLL